MPPKTKQPETLWSQCNDCKSFIVSKEIKNHSSECSVSLESKTQNFIKDNVLYGTLDAKTNEEIKNVSTHNRDLMVFVSQSVMQLLNIAIGDWAILNDIKQDSFPVARIVWPTVEKSCTSILLTKNCKDIDNKYLHIKLILKFF